MKKLIMLATILLSSVVIAQEQDRLSVNNNNNSYSLGTHLSTGLILSPYGNPSFTLDLELKNSKLFGFGVELNFGIYDSPDLNLNPPVTEIQGYNPNSETFSGIDGVYGNAKDGVKIVSFYASKGMTLNKTFAFNFKIGPSINFVDKNNFNYRYNEAFGGFGGFYFGNDSPSFIAEPSSSNKTVLGLNLKVTALIKIGKKTTLGLSPYSNINKEQTIFGLQFGFVFGKKYKQLFFN